jgi:hypothetical protein
LCQRVLSHAYGYTDSQGTDDDVEWEESVSESEEDPEENPTHDD